MTVCTRTSPLYTPAFATLRVSYSYTAIRFTDSLRASSRRRFTTTRGGAVWWLVGLITRRSRVQILLPLPHKAPVIAGVFRLLDEGSRSVAVTTVNDAIPILLVAHGRTETPQKVRIC